MAEITTLIQLAVERRSHFIDPNHISAFRLFNGFGEGDPSLCVDIFATTAVIHNYYIAPSTVFIQEISDYLTRLLPWITCIIVKSRGAKNSEDKNGKIVFGTSPDTVIWENGVWYAIDLKMNRDTGFYLDTRNLRIWAKSNLSQKIVLNTFAYTGSLGIASLAGGAARVVQLDRNSTFLDIAKKSSLLNHLPVSSQHLIAEDFFPAVSKFKRTQTRFDCVFLDPPFFSQTAHGRIDLENNYTQLINKVRPVIVDNGWLVVINNALFLSGKEFLSNLEVLCKDGYLQIETFIKIPEDFAGDASKVINQFPVDPTPFNHSTKIVVLRVKRK